MKRVQLSENLSGYTGIEGITYVFADSDHIDEVVEYIHCNPFAGIHVSKAIGNYKESHLGFLSRCKNLHALYLQDEPTDISGISELQGLKILAINADTVWKDFSCFPELELFSGVYHKSIVHLNDCARLRKVSFRKLSTSSKTLTDLVLPDGIEEIIATKGNLVSLCGLERYRALKRLELNYLRNLDDIKCLLKLKELRELEIESCKKALDVEVIRRIHSLCKLKLTNNGELMTLDFTHDLQNLSFFTFIDTKVASGDLSPLLSHPKLKYAGFMDARAYNYSFDQIQHLLSQRS